jgi:hypothetical protein
MRAQKILCSSRRIFVRFAKKVLKVTELFRAQFTVLLYLTKFLGCFGPKPFIYRVGNTDLGRAEEKMLNWSLMKALLSFCRSSAWSISSSQHLSITTISIFCMQLCMASGEFLTPLPEVYMGGRRDSNPELVKLAALFPMSYSRPQELLYSRPLQYELIPPSMSYSRPL